MTVDKVFQLLKYRATKSGYNTSISANDFNLIFPAAEIRYYNKLFGNQNEYQVGNPIPRISYPETLKISTSLSVFGGDPIPISIDSDGKYTKDPTMFYIDSISHNYNSVPTPIERVEKMELSDRLKSYYQQPTLLYPIYVEYNDYIQFYPINLGTAILTPLNAPIQTIWAYTLNGGVNTTNTLVSGSGYANGVHPNINLTGGDGNSAVGTITVAGGVVTAIEIPSATAGFGYAVGNTLSATFGGGSGFSVVVSTISNARQVYDAGNSVDPQWKNTDIDEIIYLCLKDIGIYNRDNQVEQFAMVESRTGGI